MSNAQPSWAPSPACRQNGAAVVVRIHPAGAMMYLTILRQIHRAHGLAWAGHALLLGIFLMLMFYRPAMAQEVPGGCGSLKNAFGPIDYRPEKYVYELTYKSHNARLKLVEDYHYTIETQMLRGKGNATGADLDYTLRAFPNHHRALLTLIALGEKQQTSQPQGLRYSIDCWFRRAVAWTPDDSLVRLIYAQYLQKSKLVVEADQQLRIADSQAAENAFTQHNIGLIYFDMKDYDKALVHAHKAYALGFGLPTLRDRLKGVGKWVDPPETSPGEPPANQK